MEKEKETEALRSQLGQWDVAALVSREHSVECI